MDKNTAGQKWRVFAFNVTTNEPVTGDAANITAKISKDYGTATALTDTNPTETEDGYYLFDLTKAETNADDLAIYPESSTADVQVIGVPGNYSTDEVTASASVTVRGSEDVVPFSLFGPLIDVDPANGQSDTISPTALASDAYLDRYLSSAGVDSFSDHYERGYPDDIATVMRDCKIYAGGLLSSRLAHRYLYSALINVPMMEEVWAVIVLRTLCYRRGNPPPASLEFRYQEYMQKDGLIDQIAHGLFPLTDANGNPIRPKNSNIPAHSNLMVDRRYAESQIRVWSGSSDRSQSALGRKFDRHNEYGE